ncbi:MAG: hypothetical protein ACRERC_24145 [Candidatus Binatia bacterium]
MENRIMTATRGEFITLICALALFGCLIGFMAGCGTEDLTFPGDFPATPTGAPTSTNTPDDEE